MSAALERGEWSAARPGRTLPLGKTRYQFYRRLGGPQGRPGRAENLVPTGIRSRTVQPVISKITEVIVLHVICNGFLETHYKFPDLEIKNAVASFSTYTLNKRDLTL